MATLTLMHWLLIANFGLMLVLTASLVAFRRQQVREAKRLDSAMTAINQAQGALTKSTVGMGRRLKQLHARVQDAERRVSLPAADDASFAQATRLVGLGATVNDLVDNCGVPRGEAELLVTLKKRQAASAANSQSSATH